MKAAYFHCIGGVSGDMVLGALVDAGLPIDSLLHELSKLPLQGYRITVTPDTRAAISGARVTVTIGPGPQPHRNLADILSLINESSLPTPVKRNSSDIFTRLAQSESRVHKVPTDQVHFHEVGAVDAIVDIVGAACGLHLLGVEGVYSSPIPAGSGTVRSEHGRLPVPAPATLELMSLAHAPFAPPSPHAPATELSTPTGVAILTSLAEFSQPEIRIESVGYGIGQKDMGEYPNALGLWIGEVQPFLRTRPLAVIDTNIDDMNPEIYPYLVDRLLQLGARDVWLTPIQMKKGRPAHMLSVLANLEEQQAIIGEILKETSTLGVRISHVMRQEAERRVEKIETSLGPVRVKLKLQDGAPVSLAPEYEDCAAIASSTGLPIKDVYNVVTQEASRRFITPS